MSSTKSPKLSQEPPSGWRALYSGQTCLGHLLSRGKAGTEAFDRNDRSLGIFPDQKSAADAISAAGASS